jgi:hypothetical protein
MCARSSHYINFFMANIQYTLQFECLPTRLSYHSHPYDKIIIHYFSLFKVTVIHVVGSCIVIIVSVEAVIRCIWLEGYGI